jgi:GT2 family glycosyltransferase
MCIEYAMQTNASHLLFCDADIIPPHDIIPKLLAVFDKVPTEAVGGLVHGRGTHSNLRYVFGQKREVSLDGYTLLELEHSNIGFTMLTSRAFNQIRFRYGVSEYPDGRNHMISDDPAYHLDAFKKFGTWMYVRTDVLGRHVGDLQPHQTAQF